MLLIRTGTGFIDVAAQNNILVDGDINDHGPTDPSGVPAYVGAQSSIYTAGLSAAPLPGFKTPKDADYPTDFVGGSAPIFYGTDGGNIAIAAGGNVLGPNLIQDYKSLYGVNTLQTIYQWFYSEGALKSDGAYAVQTTWWTNYSQFQQGIGALGGGDILLTAGGSLRSLGVVIPTNGRVYGGTRESDLPDAGNLVTQGAGDLTVQVENNLQDDIFFVGKGQGNITVGGSVLAPASTPDGSGSYGTSFALGDASLSVQTGGDLVVNRIFNPSAVFTNATYLFGDTTPTESNFVTYSPTDAVTLTSLGGNLDYIGTSTPLPLGVNTNGDVSLLPPVLSMVALQGDIAINSSVATFSSPSAQLDILANGNIDLAGPPLVNLLIVQTDIDPVNNPGVTAPTTELAQNYKPLNPGLDGDVFDNADPQPDRIFALTGDILNTSAGVPDEQSYTDFVLAKPAELQAGRDINDIGVIGQNNAATDVTSVIAGRDITYDVVDSGGGGTPVLGEYGGFLPNNNVGAFGIELGGPGTLYVQAGRDIELAASNGILTYGNSVDPYLPTVGAGIVAIAGGAPDYADFIARYIGPSEMAAGDYLPDLADYLSELRGTSVAVSQAWALYRTLPADQQDAFARDVYFDILRETADSTNLLTYKNYSFGYGAAATLFPGAYNGNIDLFYSQIETQDGGGIQLFAPGGQIIAGFPHEPELGFGENDLGGMDKTAAQLGIFTVAGGEIDSFSQGSVLVNQSRIFTDDGGDVVIWSSTGDINAGKGPKSAQAAPAPLEEIDSSGNIVSIPAGAATGSGIAILELPGQQLFNSEYLIAPHGVVDAGDAGLRATGNINIVALQVLHSFNIEAGGKVTGVPDNAPNVGALSTASNASGAALAAAADVGKRAAQTPPPSIWIVEVLGYGGSDQPQAQPSASRKKPLVQAGRAVSSTAANL